MTNFTDMLSKAKEMQNKMKEAQDAIKKIEVEGEAGGNLVKVTLLGCWVALLGSCLFVCGLVFTRLFFSSLTPAAHAVQASASSELIASACWPGTLRYLVSLSAAVFGWSQNC